MVAVQSRYISSQFNKKTALQEDASSPAGNLLESWLVTLASYFPGYTPAVSSITLADNSVVAITGTAPVSIPTRYGHLLVQSNGSYQFVANNANSLREGETATENFRFTVKSGSFTTTASISVTITGTNDTPVATVDTGSVLEGATLAVTAARGVLSNDRDADAGDTLSVSRVSSGSVTLPSSGDDDAASNRVGTAITGTYGQLTLNRDGSYSYVANTRAANTLGAGQTAADVFTYQVSDGKGGFSQTTLSLRVTGSNDGPLAFADTASLTENAEISRTAAQGLLANDRDPNGDRLVVLDISAGDTRVAASNTGNQSITGTYGQLSFSANGAYSFRANTAQAESLKAGQTASETFTYRISDGKGGVSSATLSIRITGSNDRPTANADTASVNENATIRKSASQGLLANDQDPDADRLSITAVGPGNDAQQSALVGQSVTGAYGHLTLHSNGSYSYTADTTRANALAVGQTATESFSYRISDGKGGTSSATLTITITGKNDGPVAQADTASLTENGKLSVGTASGLLVNDRDVDGDNLKVVGVAAGDASPVSSNVDKALAGTYGQLTVHNNGNYEYKADSKAANALRAGETATEVFSYRISDNKGGTAVSTLTITVTGTNDAPIAMADTGTVQEAASLAVSSAEGLLSNDRDADNGDILRVISVGVGRESTPSANNLGRSIQGQYGHLLLNSDGSYTYVADTAAASALGAGQSATEVFTYRIADSAGTRAQSTLTLTIRGSSTGVQADVAEESPAPIVVEVAPNRPPSANADNAQVLENASTTSGVLTNDTDPDGHPLTVMGVASGNAPPSATALGLSLAGNFGHLTLHPNGSYTYQADQADQLRLGQVATDTFTYQVSDGRGGVSSASLTLSITGTNDAPIATLNNQQVAEDASVSVSALSGVLVNDSDVDGDILNVSAVAAQGSSLSGDAVGQSVLGTYGHLTLNGDGSYHYAADTPAANRLKLGEVRSDQFTYQVADGQGGLSTASLTISVTGTNDAPLLNADAAGVSEDGSFNRNASNGALSNDSDVDGDALVVAAVAAGAQTLQAGAVGTAILGTYGHLTMNADGSYSYAADTAAANGLKLGEIRTDNFSYMVSDGQGGTAVSTLTISVTGTNDTPVALADNGSVQENALLNVPAIAGVLSNDSDVDGDALIVSAAARTGTAVNPANIGQPILGTYGHLSLQSNGSYTYAADTAAANGLKVGEVRTDTFNYLVSDQRGGSSSATLTISVTGSNDGPLANGDTLTLAKGSSFSAPLLQGVLSNDSDVDGDVLNVTALALPGGSLSASLVGQSVLGTYGHLTLNADGSYTFAADTPAALALGAGQSRLETFTYQISDGQGAYSTASLAITISGSNNGPVAVADTGSVQENASLTVTAAQGLLANDSDANGDLLRITGVALGNAAPAPSNLDVPLVGTYGQLVLGSSGAYTYSASTAAANALKQGQVASESFTYQVSDGAGGLSNATLTLVITGTNDLPFVSADAASVLEDATLTRNASTGVLANDSDVDQDSLAVSAVAAGTVPPSGSTSNIGVAVTGIYGQLTMLADGSYTYAANTPAANALKQGEIRTDTFSYRVSDGQGGQAVSTLILSVTGTNDAPIASPDMSGISEDAVVQIQTLQGVLANDMDVDGDPLVVNAVAAPGASLLGSSVGQAVLGTYGHLTLYANGSYAYAADTGAANALKLGEVRTDVFQYRVSDGRGGTDIDTLTISITGTNDLPVIQGASNSVDEGMSITDNTGLLASASDADGDTLGISGFAAGTQYTSLQAPGTSVLGTYGHLTLNPDGSYTYIADTQASIDLMPGQTVADVFTYVVGDGNGGFASETLSIVVSGTAGAPMVQPSADVASVTEATDYASRLFNTGVNGAGNALAPMDTDQHYRITQAPVGSTVGANTTSNRNWAPINSESAAWIGSTNEYDLSETLNGEYRFETSFHVSAEIAPSEIGISFDIAADNVLSDILINGHPTGITFGQDTEFQAFRQLNHVDLSPFAQYFTSGENTLTFVVFNGGSYSDYYSNSSTGLMIDNVQTNLPIQFDLVASATGGIFANDELPPGSTMEVGGVAAAGNPPDANYLGQLTSGIWGQLLMNPDGSYSYTASNSNSLAAGEVVTDAFTYFVTDATGATATSTLTINITGTNDVAIIGGASTGSVTEEAFTTTEGQLSIVDADRGQSYFLAQQGVQGTYGSFGLDSSGHWTYTLDSTNAQVIALNSGQSLTESFTVTSADGTTATVQLQINGINGQSPLVLDMNGDGAQSISSQSGVRFDIDGDGDLDQTGWISAQDGLLALDLDGDGQVNDGRELFGNNTLAADGNKATNGFAALAQYDGNLDGIIDEQDAIFKDLLVWQDRNQDGQSQAEELSGLKDAGVSALNLGFKQGSELVEGNLHALTGSYIDAQGQTKEMTDVWFDTNNPTQIEAAQHTWHVDKTQASTTISGFNTAQDTLDLRDLLVGHTGSLDQYLHIERQGEDTRIEVRSEDKATVTNTVLLQGVDLMGDHGCEQQIIDELLQRNQPIL